MHTHAAAAAAAHTLAMSASGSRPQSHFPLSLERFRGFQSSSLGPARQQLKRRAGIKEARRK